MDPFKLLLAAALIVNPDFPLESWDVQVLYVDPETALKKEEPRTLPQGRQDEWFAYTAGSLQLLGVQWEVLDARECKHILTDPQEYYEDLKLLQNRFQNLIDAPPLVDCKRFPNRDAINDMLTFNRNYRRDLEARLLFDRVHNEQISAALQETDYLYRIWDTVRNARCGYYYISVRREALKELRDLIGEEAYYSGQLPPHVPVWRIPMKGK